MSSNPPPSIETTMLSNEIPRSALRASLFSGLQRNGFIKAVYAAVCLLSPDYSGVPAARSQQFIAEDHALGKVNVFDPKDIRWIAKTNTARRSQNSRDPGPFSLFLFTISFSLFHYCTNSRFAVLPAPTVRNYGSFSN